MTTTATMTVEKLLAGARAKPGRVVLPGADNEDALEAIVMALHDGVVCGGTLLGNLATTAEVAKRVGLDLARFDFIETKDDVEAATKAVRLVAEQKGDFLIKGQLDTKVYLKAILDKEMRLVPPGGMLSHVAVISMPTYHKFLISTDAAIMIAPSIEDKVHLIQNAVRYSQALGVQRPKVSLQAAVEKISPKMPGTVEADTLAKMAASGIFGNAIVEGPHDLYIAVSKEAAAIKKMTGEVCGDADILVFHDINSANIFYKSVQQFVPNAWGAGLIGGARVPILLPSRADSATSKRMNILIAAYLGTCQMQ